jgi:hypothetical protein
VDLIELWTASDLGVSGSSTPAIDLDQVNTVNVLGDLFARATASTTSVDTITVGGTMYGNVEALSGGIGTIDE